MPDNSHFGLWRVGVLGSSHSLSKTAVDMCEALGERLAQESTVLLVHGGLKRRRESRALNLAADWHFIEGAKRTLQQDIHERLETVLPEPSPKGAAPSKARSPKEGTDGAGAEMFIEGTLRRVKGRTREARRFAFVNSLDAIVAVGGSYGTRQSLTLAAAIDQPMLPVPCFEGAARDFWNDHRRDITSQLGITDATALEWEKEPATTEEIKQRVDAMVSALLTKLPKRAFIIMPYAAEHDTLYDLVIEPAVESCRDELRRLDRLQAPGTVTRQIEDGIRTSDYCIVVLDGMRPNVLYEMGYAQALRKPLILILRQGQIENQEVPFDISTLQPIEYVRPDSSVLRKLRIAVREVVRRSIS